MYNSCRIRRILSPNRIWGAILLWIALTMFWMNPRSCNNDRRMTSDKDASSDLADDLQKDEHYVYHDIIYSTEPQSCDRCFRRNFPYLNLPKNICKPKLAGGAVTVDLLVAIHSTPRDLHARSLLRDTWLSSTRGNTAPSIRHVFVLGAVSSDKMQAMINAESAIYNDIVQSSFVDSYRNLTLKTLLILDWALEFCSNARFVLKTDEDVFVNVPMLLRITGQASSDTSVLGRSRSLRPVRARAGRTAKWRVSIAEYPRSHYPPFPSGLGYIVPMAIVSELLDVSVNTPFFHLEDVYLGLLLEKTTYDIIDVGNMSNNGSLPYCCMELRNITVMHVTKNIGSMYNIWTSCFESNTRIEALAATK